MTTKVAPQAADTPNALQATSSTDRVAPLSEVVAAITADCRIQPERYLEEVIVPRSAGE